MLTILACAAIARVARLGLDRNLMGMMSGLTATCLSSAVAAFAFIRTLNRSTRAERPHSTLEHADLLDRGRLPGDSWAEMRLFGLWFAGVICSAVSVLAAGLILLCLVFGLFASKT
jgi:hypothetical protein